MQFQNELQMLGMDGYQVGEVMPINPYVNQSMEDSRRCGGCGRCGGMCGGFRCGGFRCGGFRCGGCFGCFGCFSCFGCSNCSNCSCSNCFGFAGSCVGFGIGFI